MASPCERCKEYDKTCHTKKNKECPIYKGYLEKQAEIMHRQRKLGKEILEQARQDIPIDPERVTLLANTKHASLRNERGMVIVRTEPTAAQIEAKAKQLLRASVAVTGKDNPDYIPGTNAEDIDFTLGLLRNEPVDLKDLDAISTRFMMFLEYCRSKDKRPNLGGWIVALGLSRNKYTQIMRGMKPHEVAPGTIELLQRCKSALGLLWENAISDGNVQQIVGIFLAKANYGYKDNPEAEAAAQEERQKQTAEEIKKKYADLE